jgi:hypothetical protein
MMQKGAFIIGMVMGIVWWFGLGADRSATILWFDAVGAVLSFGIGALVDGETRPSQAPGAAVLGMGLAAVWAVGMATHQPAWANWMNFLFAMAYLALAIGAATRRNATRPV